LINYQLEVGYDYWTAGEHFLGNNVVFANNIVSLRPDTGSHSSG
jgi:hypothetical protein